MVGIIPASVVPAPEPRGLRYGLLTAANGPLDLPVPHGRAGGVTYEPVSCGFARLQDPQCRDADTTPTTKSWDGCDELVSADPFIVYATYKIGSAGHTPAQLRQKVERRLLNGEQSVVESALATTLSGDASTVTAPNPDELASVVGELEQWLYGSTGANYGNVGYLHAPFRLAAIATRDHLYYSDGPLLRTRLGTIWVFGDYPDDGTVYISGQVTVWRSPDVIVPPVEQVLNRATNHYHLIAEREYAVAYDCVAAGATFTGEVPLS